MRIFEVAAKQTEDSFDHIGSTGGTGGGDGGDGEHVRITTLNLLGQIPALIDLFN